MRYSMIVAAMGLLAAAGAAEAAPQLTNVTLTSVGVYANGAQVPQNYTGYGYHQFYQAGVQGDEVAISTNITDVKINFNADLDTVDGGQTEAVSWVYFDLSEAAVVHYDVNSLVAVGGAHTVQLNILQDDEPNVDLVWNVFPPNSNSNPPMTGTFELPAGHYAICFDLAGQGAGSAGTETTLQFQAIPEPASLALLALGGVGMLGRRRKA